MPCVSSWIEKEIAHQEQRIAILESALSDLLAAVGELIALEDLPESVKHATRN